MSSGDPVRRRGDTLLLRHIAILDRLAAEREPTARTRLEHELGRETAHVLVSALSGVASRSRPATR